MSLLISWSSSMLRRWCIGFCRFLVSISGSVGTRAYLIMWRGSLIINSTCYLGTPVLMWVGSWAMLLGSPEGVSSINSITSCIILTPITPTPIASTPTIIPAPTLLTVSIPVPITTWTSSAKLRQFHPNPNENSTLSSNPKSPSKQTQSKH